MSRSRLSTSIIEQNHIIIHSCLYLLKRKLSGAEKHFLGTQTLLQTMPRLLMSNKLVLPIEAPGTIPLTARMETLKGAHDREVLLEMAGQVAVALESLGAVFVSAEEARLNI